LAISVKSAPAATIVSPSGDIDLTGSPTLKEEMRRVFAGAPQRVVVDLSAVPYMDSSAVATLVEAMQMARKGKARLVLCAMQERVRSIFEIARLESVFTIVNTVDDALKV
jgi:anti-sigma B factor antagonist